MTNVFHGSKEESSVETISSLEGCCLRQTKPRFRRAGIGRRCCDTSMGQVERANFEYLAASCHLPDSFSNSHRQLQIKKSDVSTCSFRLPFAGEFLIPSQIKLTHCCQ